MLAPSPLPRNLEAAFRDLESGKASTRASAVQDVVRHAVGAAETRMRAIPLLEKALRADAAAEVRAAAALALADLHASEVLAALLVAVEDEDPHVRQMALSALGEIGDARAAPRLERALRDERAEVRYQAVIAYARVMRDDPHAVANALAHALSDGDGAIRYIAMRVAEEHGVDGEPLRDARLAARAEELIDSADAAVSVVAAIYLARIGSAKGRGVVLSVIAGRKRTPELEDEQACVDLAGDSSLREAIPDLERRIWGTQRVLRTILSWGAGDSASCAWHARIALARMGHAKARAEILADLASWRRETREAAVVAAGRARMSEARGALEKLGESVDGALVREALVRLAVG
jgi:HEAT repeat protein